MFVFSLALASCGGGGGGGVDSAGSSPPPPSPYTTTPATNELMSARDWEIGPIIDGKNYSHGVPLNPVAEGSGWYIDLPQSDGVHYVTRRFGSLTGKRKITIKYRIELADGAQIVPSGGPGHPSIGPTLYFQRRGDDWRSDGWRWWATFSSPTPMVAGTFEVTVPLDGAWTSVNTKTAANSPNDFASAIQNAERLGFTLGGATGFGHGVYATGRARMVVTDFIIE